MHLNLNFNLHFCFSICINSLVFLMTSITKRSISFLLQCWYCALESWNINKWYLSKHRVQTKHSIEDIKCCTQICFILFYLHSCVLYLFTKYLSVLIYKKCWIDDLLAHKLLNNKIYTEYNKLTKFFIVVIYDLVNYL